MEKKLTTSQLAKELAVHKQTIYRWRRRGEIVGVMDEETGRILFAYDQVQVGRELLRRPEAVVRNLDGMLTVLETAERLGVTTQTVYAYRNQGLLKGFYGKNSSAAKLFFTVVEVEELARANQNSAHRGERGPRLRPVRCHLFGDQIQYIKDFGAKSAGAGRSPSFSECLRSLIEAHRWNTPKDDIETDKVANEPPAKPEAPKNSGFLGWLWKGGE